MTLKEIVQALETIASRQPNIHHIVKSGDIYDLNDTDVDYAAFCVTQQQHSANSESITFNLTLFYVDRLTDSKDNKLDIQSHAIETLRNILLTFEEENYYGVEYTSTMYTTFTQRFLSECAGAYATITVSVPNEGGCAEKF